MVFQNKPNVAQYFVICFIFILSFFFCSNASAIRKNINGIRVTSINYNTVNPSGSVTNLSLLSDTFAPMTYANIPSNKVFQISSLKMNFVNNYAYSIKKDKKFSYEINVIAGYKNYAGTGYQLSPVPQAQCPLGNNGYVIDDCQISIETLDSATVKLYTQGQVNIPNTDQLLSEGYTFNRWVIKLNGHWGRDNSTVYSFDTAGIILAVYNPSIVDLSSYDFVYTFSFPTIYFYDEEESAEEEAAQKELESTTNIENQTSQNTTGGTSENQQTTNLIGVFSGFLTELQSFSATNCNLDLPFPSFIGGTQTVNICQGKDVLGNFITVVGTLAMVTFYIPLAFVLLKMIYNEIRSFTNG